MFAENSGTGFTIWLTGLQGAGKRTLAREVVSRLARLKKPVELLEGANWDVFLGKGPGSTPEERDAIVRRNGFIAGAITRAGGFVVIAQVSPCRETRDLVRGEIGRFLEVFVDCTDRDLLVSRDTTGEYRRALRGEIPNFIGVTDPYEPPTSPDVHYDSSRQTIDEGAALVLHALVLEGALTADEVDVFPMPAKRVGRVPPVKKGVAEWPRPVFAAQPTPDARPDAIDQQSSRETVYLRNALSPYLACPLEVLGQLPIRAQKLFSLHRVDTIGDIVNLFETGQASVAMELGTGPREVVIRRLNDLGRLGPVRLVFGRDTLPPDAASLWYAYLAQLDDEGSRSFVDRRFRKRETLDAIGEDQERTLSRERVRQIIDVENIHVDRPSWREAALAIIHPVLNLLKAGAGVGSLDECVALAGAEYPGQLELVAELAEVRLFLPLDGELTGVATLLSSAELDSSQTELRERVEDCLKEGGKYEGCTRVLRDWGMRLSPHHELWMLTSFLGFELREKEVYSGRRRAQTVFVEALRTAGRAASAQEISDLLIRASPDLAATPRNVVSHFAESPNVFNVGLGSWVHIDNLGVSREELERVANACLSLVPTTGVTVDVKSLLTALGPSVPEGLSAYAVRDAMIHTRKVRGWRAGCGVAWLGPDTTR